MAVVDSSIRFPLSLPGAGLAAKILGGRLHFIVKIYLILVLLPFAYPAGPLVMTGVRTLLILMILPMMGRLLAGKCGKIWPTDYLFMAHLFWILVTLAVNNPTQVVQNFGSTGMEFLGGYLLGRNFIRSKENMIGLFRFAVFLVICSLPLAIYETLTGRPLIIWLWRYIPGITGSFKASSLPRMGLERVQMGFATPIHYGVYATMAFSVCYVGLKNIYSGTRRMVSTAIVALCIFLSLSSGALLPMLLQMFLIGWNRAFRKSASRWMLLLGFFAFCYVLVDVLSNRTPYRVFMTYATFSPGTAYWRAAINEFGMNNVYAHPIFGIGLNNWVRPAWMHSNSVDNFWLLMAMRHGVPGFLLVASGYGYALWKIMRKDLGNDPVLLNLRLAWVFTFASLAFTLTTVHIWTEIYSYVFFSIGAGMWMLSVSPEDADKTGAEVVPVARGGTILRSAPRQVQPAERQQAPERTAAPARSLTDAEAGTIARRAAQAQQTAPGSPPVAPREAARDTLYTRFPPKSRDPS